MGKHSRSVMVLLVASAMSSCVTDNAALEEQRFDSFKGKTMAAFMADTLATPSQYYEQGGMRVFVVDAGFNCRMLIETRANGAGSGPGGWTILRTLRRGGCASV